MVSWHLYAGVHYNWGCTLGNRAGESCLLRTRCVRIWSSEAPKRTLAGPGTTTKYNIRTTCTLLKPTIPLLPAHESQTYSNYELPDKNRDIHSTATKYQTRTVTVHSAETRVTFSDDHYEKHDQNSHTHSAGYISTQWPPASAGMN